MPVVRKTKPAAQITAAGARSDAAKVRKESQQIRAQLEIMSQAVEGLKRRLEDKSTAFESEVENLEEALDMEEKQHDFAKTRIQELEETLKQKEGKLHRARAKNERRQKTIEGMTINFYETSVRWLNVCSQAEDLDEQLQKAKSERRKFIKDYNDLRAKYEQSQAYNRGAIAGFSIGLAGSRNTNLPRLRHAITGHRHPYIVNRP